MTWKTLTVVEARCDTCDLIGVDEDDARWFISRRTARDILNEHGWTFTGNNSETATCPGCVQTAACTLVGHQWGQWTDRTYPWYIGRTRTCYRCDTTEGDPPIPDARPAERTAP